MEDFIKTLKKLIVLSPIPLTIVVGILFFILPLGPFRKLGIIFMVFTPVYIIFRRRLLRNRRYGKTKNHKDIFDEKKDFRIVSQPVKKYPDQPVTKKSHYKDIKTCERTLKDIKKYITNQKLGSEYKKIHKQLKEEYINLKSIASKLDLHIDTLNNPDWDTQRIERQLIEEDKKEPKDLKRIERLTEMKNHIDLLKERVDELRNQISDTALSFQSIFSKITLVDKTDIDSYDEIETEIQKMLDFKLRVNSIEKQLDEEMQL